jgi:glutamate dehydrogenase (NADP+)
MTQNSMRLPWSREEVDEPPSGDHEEHPPDLCGPFGTRKDGYVNYVNGANVGGFVKVADAMLAQGVV